MYARTCSLLVLLSAATHMCMCADVSAQDSPFADAWKALPKYEYGQDMGPLLAIDRAVIEAMKSPEARSACAARLAKLLVADGTTLAARQYICMQLRQVGTAAQVPVLAELLAKKETSDMARQALQAIPGLEASEVLRGALNNLQGKSLVGVINSVAARKDVQAVESLCRLADSEDQDVADAAIWALGSIGGDSAIALLQERVAKASNPVPERLAVPLLRCAARCEAAGKFAVAKTIFDQLSQSPQAPGVRRSALEGLLRMRGKKATATIITWLVDGDVDQREIALQRCRMLSREQVDQLLAKLADLPESTQLALIELAASRRGKAILPMILSMVNSDQPELKLSAVRYLGMIGDASAIPLLLKMLQEKGDLAVAARNALSRLPRKEVVAALLQALKREPAIREPVIALLVELKCYDAIDPLIEIASRDDPAEYGPALAGLRGIADPDKTDIPRLVKLLLRTEAGRHRDEVEKTILIVTEKLPKGADRSQLVRAALQDVPASESPKYLPLLGRLGGANSLELIDAALKSSESDVRAAALRALCNWPTAMVADRLLELAENAKDRSARRAALRAYIRVVTLKSDRPESATLAMLQKAMTLAQQVDDRRLVLERASTVRTMDTVNWIATHLDDPDVNQAACKALVELAHHRFLRHPNMKVFGPLLKKVEQICKDPELVARAKRYRLGL